MAWKSALSRLQRAASAPAPAPARRMLGFGSDLMAHRSALAAAKRTRTVKLKMKSAEFDDDPEADAAWKYVFSAPLCMLQDAALRLLTIRFCGCTFFPLVLPLFFRRRIALKVKDEDYRGVDSKYVSKMRSSGRFDLKAHVSKLEDEMMEEMAEALRRTVYKTDQVFAMLDIAMHELQSSSTLAEWQERLNSFKMVRVAAGRRRNVLAVHRRALGFRIRNEEAVQQMYPLPPIPEPCFSVAGMTHAHEDGERASEENVAAREAGPAS
eukprot:scaffold2326_cov286-Pinguiococcus_pyrenoidosus.AAC.6